MSEQIFSVLVIVADNPLLLAVILFGATFVAEDIATIAAGVLVGQLGASSIAALSGVILGTAFGDIALFMVGRWGAHSRLGKRLRMRTDVCRAEGWVRDHTLWLVFAARFLPGTRLPIFTASGYVRAPASAVVAIIALTTPVWTAALFETARRAGSASAEQLVTSILPLGLMIAGASFLIRRRALAA